VNVTKAGTQPIGPGWAQYLRGGSYENGRAMAVTSTEPNTTFLVKNSFFVAHTSLHPKADGQVRYEVLGRPRGASTPIAARISCAICGPGPSTGSGERHHLAPSAARALQDVVAEHALQEICPRQAGLARRHGRCRRLLSLLAVGPRLRHLSG
jgi:hypothetical protein